MPFVYAGTTAWGVRVVLTSFVVACRLYNKHRDRCEHYLAPEICGTLSAVCDIVESLHNAYDLLPPVGTRG